MVPGHVALTLGGLVRHALGNDRTLSSTVGVNNVVIGQRTNRISTRSNTEYGGVGSLGFLVPVTAKAALFGTFEGIFLGKSDYDLSGVVGLQFRF